MQARPQPPASLTSSAVVAIGYYGEVGPASAAIPSTSLPSAALTAGRASLGDAGVQKLARLRLARLWRAGEAGSALAGGVAKPRSGPPSRPRPSRGLGTGALHRGLSASGGACLSSSGGWMRSPSRAFLAPGGTKSPLSRGGARSAPSAFPCCRCARGNGDAWAGYAAFCAEAMVLAALGCAADFAALRNAPPQPGAECEGREGTAEVRIRPMV